MRLNGILVAVVLTAATRGRPGARPGLGRDEQRARAGPAPGHGRAQPGDRGALRRGGGRRADTRSLRRLPRATTEGPARGPARAEDPAREGRSTRRSGRTSRSCSGEVELDLAGQELSEKLELPYYDLNRLVFHSLRGLLDERVAAERRPAALERLKRYAGLAEGYEPIALLATQRTREKLDQAGLRAPYRGELEKGLADGPQMRAGLAPLFEEFGIEGYEGALEVLEDQLAVYDDFVRKELLPQGPGGLPAAARDLRPFAPPARDRRPAGGAGLAGPRVVSGRSSSRCRRSPPRSHGSGPCPRATTAT